MKKNKGRLQPRMRQRQKPTRRVIVLMMASFMTSVVIVLTVFFHIGKVEKSAAKEVQIAEQAFAVEKTLPAPIITSEPLTGSTTLLVRKAKEVPVEITNSK